MNTTRETIEVRGHIATRKSKKSGKLFYVVLTIGGKAKWKKVPGTQTQRNAEEYRIKLISELQKGPIIDPVKIHFKDFVKIWWAKYGIAMAPNSKETYRVTIDNYLSPFFGTRQMSQISVEDVQELSTLLLGKLSPLNTKNILIQTKLIFRHAEEWGYLKYNPVAKIKYPRVPKREMDFLTPNEIRLFLESTSSHKWYCFFLVAVTTGLRIGELLVMRWKNVDWEKGKYFVRETLIYVPKEKSIKTPKSDASNNSVDLTPSCIME